MVKTVVPGESMYSVYYIGKDKKKRQIQEPSAALKFRQRNFLEKVQGWVEFHECVQGGVPGRGVMTALARHKNAAVIFKTDIKAFFRSTTKGHILRALRLMPLRDSVKNTIREGVDELCLFHCAEKPILPTGAPTSPFLGNIAASVLDSKIEVYLNDLYKQCGITGTYSRYIDDITISFEEKDRCSASKVHKKIRTDVHSLICSSGYQPAKDKTQWMLSGKDNMEILGITQDSQGTFRVPRKLRRTMRAALHNCQGKPDTKLAAQLEYIKSVNVEQYDTLVLTYMRG